MKEIIEVITHPLAQAILTLLRDRNTDQITFRKGMVRLGRIIGLEMVKHMDTEKYYVETPLGVKAEGIRIPDMEKVIIINVLRAAMPLVEGLIKIFPSARQGVISARRVEEKGMGDNYVFDIEVSYIKIPKINSDDTLIIADPMFATGSTMLTILDKLIKIGEPKRIFIATVISTKIAIEKVANFAKERNIYNKIKIFTVSIDPEINEKGYIVPGLGDAGDRAFGG